MATSPTRQHVMAGACFTTDTDAFTGCALRAADCSDAETYKPARVLTGNAQACLSTEAPKAITVGRCTASGKCAMNAASCEIPSSFEPDFSCTVVRDGKDRTVNNFSVYGQCSRGKQEKENAYCAVSPDDCNSGYKFIPADNNFAVDQVVLKCNCDDVLTGACVQGNNIQCAVAPDSCQTASEFVPVQGLSSYNTECFLCSQEVEMPPTPAPISAKEQAKWDARQQEIQEFQSGLEIGAVIGIAVGALLALCLLGCCYFGRRRYCGKDSVVAKENAGTFHSNDVGIELGSKDSENPNPNMGGHFS